MKMSSGSSPALKAVCTQGGFLLLPLPIAPCLLSLSHTGSHSGTKTAQRVLGLLSHGAQHHSQGDERFSRAQTPVTTPFQPHELFTSFPTQAHLHGVNINLVL